MAELKNGHLVRESEAQPERDPRQLELLEWGKDPLRDVERAVRVRNAFSFAKLAEKLGAEVAYCCDNPDVDVDDDGEGRCLNCSMELDATDELLAAVDERDKALEREGAELEQLLGGGRHG